MTYKQQCKYDIFDVHEMMCLRHSCYCERQSRRVCAKVDEFTLVVTSLRKEELKKKKKVMAQDRKSKRQTEKQDSSHLGFRFATSDGTHDMCVYIYACVIFPGG